MICGLSSRKFKKLHFSVRNLHFLRALRRVNAAYARGNYKIYSINSKTCGNKKGMKNFCITFFLIIIIIATVIFAAGGNSQNTQPDAAEYLRMHVRANSNSAEDQAVKYKVRDAVVQFITPYAAQCGDKQSAMDTMDALSDKIAELCDGVLRENGYFYGARAEVRKENFPTRVYGDVTLESGVYDALIVELGSGKGDNWWCVLYPPLCFTAAEGNVVYRSLICDIIRTFFE